MGMPLRCQQTTNKIEEFGKKNYNSKEEDLEEED